MPTQTHLIIDLGLLTAFVAVLYFFVFRPALGIRKHMEEYGRINKLIEAAKTAEDFEAAYRALKKENFDILYFMWCFQFAERLKEIQNQIITDVEEKRETEKPHPLYTFGRLQELLNFFGSVGSYLTPVERNILNGITDKHMGMSMLSGSLF